MKQYIVRYTKSASAPQEEKDRVKSFPGVQVVDESSRMLLIQTSPETAAALDAALPDWAVSAEQEYTLPNPRPKVLNGPGEK
jgi:hypothetical protein